MNVDVRAVPHGNTGIKPPCNAQATTRRAALRAGAYIDGGAQGNIRAPDVVNTKLKCGLKVKLRRNIRVCQLLANVARVREAVRVNPLRRKIIVWRDLEAVRHTASNVDLGFNLLLNR